MQKDTTTSTELEIIEATDEARSNSDGSGSELLELVLQAQAEAATRSERVDGVMVGEVVSLTDGEVRVCYDGCTDEAGRIARTILPITALDIGKPVALMFEGGDLQKPIAVGPIHGSRPEHPAVVDRDGERIELSAEKQIVLRCGKASITLTRAGKIIIRGAYVITRSSGVNRIQGGSVQIN